MGGRSERARLIEIAVRHTRGPRDPKPEAVRRCEYQPCGAALVPKAGQKRVRPHTRYCCDEHRLADWKARNVRTVRR